LAHAFSASSRPHPGAISSTSAHAIAQDAPSSAVSDLVTPTRAGVAARFYALFAVWTVAWIARTEWCVLTLRALHVLDDLLHRRLSDRPVDPAKVQ